MITIDLDRIREGLPKRAVVKLRKQTSSGKTATSNGNLVYIDCFIPNPSLSESDEKMCMDWQENIIGKENIAEFYTKETGRHWYVYLKRQPIEFANVEDSDVNSFVNHKVVKDGKISL